MRLHRVLAVLRQEYYITIRSVEIIFDIVFMPVMSIVVFGFLSSYFAGLGDPKVASSLLLGMILWQGIFIVQYSVAVGSLWNIWSRNLSTMFVSPLSIKEYILSHTLSGILKAIIMIVLASLMCYFIFGFNILVIGLPYLLLFFALFTLFAFAIGTIILGLIFRFGTKIQALAWGTLFMLQPLAAVFYPVSILPKAFQYISYAMPATYVFESARSLYIANTLNWNALQIAFVLDIVYVLFAVWFFGRMYRASRISGQFARNES